MSKEPEESVDSQDLNAPEDSEEVVAAEESVETETAEDSETMQEPAAEHAEEENPPESTPLNDKILAIKSALKTQEEERQQEETKLQIADKVKKYKSVKEGAAAEPSESTVQEEIPEESEDSSKESPNTKSKPKHKKKKKKSKQKKSKKKQRFALFPQKGDSVFEVIRKCVFLSSTVIFAVCLGLIAEYFLNNYMNARMSDNIREQYVANTIATDTVEETTEPPDDDYERYWYLPGAEGLLEINPDVVGWISIPGTNVSYPVLQRKGQEDGNDYYLKRNIYLEDAHAGSIFMDYRNDFDYVIGDKKQVENSDNLIIYGHNMHDYSMFGGLKHYVNDANYYSEHPIVELNSNYRQYKYKIFGMIIVDIEDQTETKFDYWNQLNFYEEQAFYDYVNEIKRRTIRLNDVDVTYGDELLTLSTCNSTFSDGRLVIFARKLRDGEDLYAGTETSTANPNVKWPNSYYRWHKNTYDPDAEFVPYG